MGDLMRFGRRVPLPSSVAILHELLVMGRNDNKPEPDISRETEAKAALEPEISAPTQSLPPKPD